MKNIVLVGSLLVGALMIGCGSDGGECCGANGLAGLGGVDSPNGPAALFDGNATIKRVIKSSGTVAGDNSGSSTSSKVDAENIKFIFNCNRSVNQDDANISITDCSWNFADTSGCLDKNASVGKVVDVIYSCNESVIDGNMTVSLKVTDELNQTASSSENLVIKKNENNVTVTNRLGDVTTLQIGL
jgi:hypothetical protein